MVLYGYVIVCSVVVMVGVLVGVVDVAADGVVGVSQCRNYVVGIAVGEDVVIIIYMLLLMLVSSLLLCIMCIVRVSPDVVCAYAPVVLVLLLLMLFMLICMPLL